MTHDELHQLLGLLALMLASAKALAILARFVGLPPLLGEMLAGILLGRSILGLIDTDNVGLHAIALCGIVLFLFQVGLELDFGGFLKAVRPAAGVAIIGTLLPLTLGYFACLLAGLPSHTATGVGAAITATSLGVTARVLSDLNRLNEPESNIILAGALFSSIMGLLLMGIVADLARGEDVSLLQVALRSGLTYGFLLLLLIPGSYLIPRLFSAVSEIKVPYLLTTLAVAAAFGLSWVAVRAGSVSAMGALLAGILIARSPHGRVIRDKVADLQGVTASVAFVFLGAEIDFGVFQFGDTYHRQVMLAGVFLMIAAFAGKYLSGYGAWGLPVNKKVIGMGMVPHGEIGLLFANIGLASKLFDRALFSMVALVVFVTTFAGLIGLQAVFPMRPAPKQCPTPEDAPREVAAVI